MKIVITGSLGNISRRLAGKLIAKGHDIIVVSHNREKAKAIEELGATAAIGSAEDLNFVIDTFKGAEAVYTMVPPNFATPDYNGFSATLGKNYALAITQAGIQYVVNLSSCASPLSGVPPFTEFYNLEESLDQLEKINVLHLRPGFFYTNFYGAIPMIEQAGAIENNFDENATIILSHPQDIADAAAEALDTLSFESRMVKYIVSDRRAGKEVARILGDAIGKPDLHWVHLSDQQMLAGLMQNGFSEFIAKTYVLSSGIAIREGLFTKHYQENRHDVYGKLVLEDFAKEFAAVYKGSLINLEV
jgi:uncharacterized protein YbjT (DUF2867 family)